MTALALRATDGYPLAASLARPRGAARAVAVVNSAMGVPHRIYLPFAHWLAHHGIATLAYDYRGIAGSAPRSLRGFPAGVTDWARLDFPAAVAAARAEYPHAPLVIFGHSIGGQLFGLDRVSLGAAALVGVAAQSGYWGHWDGAGRVAVWAFWHVVIPTLVPALGYLPTRALGFGRSLPRNVALQWASWGRHPLYLRNPHSGPREQCFEAIDAPLMSIGIAHDALAPPRAVGAYRGWFTRAAVTSADLDERLGHFGWFRSKSGEPHWRALLEWLDPVL